MSRATCFSKDELRSYLLGALPDGQLDAVAFHVENCVECETTVSLLDRESDTLIESLRQPVAEQSPGSVYRLAAQRAKSYGSGSTWEPATAAPDFEGELPKLRDYELLQRIARGGMGTVYRARHVRLNRQVALKVLPARLLKNPIVVARFQREMQAVGSLQHPAIVQATDGGEADGVHFLVMELIDGFDGARLVQQLGPLPVPDACEIVRQAALGMAYVHDQGIIHRDLKPSNLMLTRTGEVKVLDLGLARVVGEHMSGDELTTVGQLMGTLDFMAPEQLENSHEVDERTDIYALGATLYKLLTGSSPHGSDSGEPILSKLRRIATESPIPLQQRLPETTDQLAELIDQMLRQDPEDRPPSMRAVADSIESHCQSSDLVKRATEAKKASAKQPDGEPATNSWHSDSYSTPAAGQPLGTSLAGRHWFLRGAVASLLLLVIAMGVVITLQTRSGQLVIETASPDVGVRILKAGQPYRDLVLEQQAETLSLGAGEYEIEITSDSDGLLIENGSYTLRRGETWVARIIHQPSTNPARANDMRVTAADRDQPEPANDAPTFESKTLAQWLGLLRRERSPKQVYEACRALKKLASGEDADEAIEAVLIATRVHDATAFYQSDTQQHMIWRTVQELFKSMDQQKVLAALSRELKRADRANRQFVLNYLMSYEPRTLPKIGDELIGQVEQLTMESQPDARISALVALRVIAPVQTTAARLVAALSDREVDVQLFAANSLIEMNSNLPPVVAALRRIVSSGSLAQRSEAAWRLGDIGPRAASALPELTACLEAESRELTSRDVPGVLQSGAGIRTTYGGVNVKDATVRAMAEIGEPSAAPALVAEWERRAYADNKTQSTAPAWVQRSQGMRPMSQNIGWVTDAIERLLGMRPASDENMNTGLPVTVWYIGDAEIGRVYRYGFNSYPGSSAEEVFSFAQKLMPRSHAFQRVTIEKFITRVDRTPTAEQLDLELKLLDLLAEYEDCRVVLKAMFGRWKEYEKIDENEWKGVEKAVALNAYCDSALEMVLRQEDWQATIVPSLLELAGNSSVPAGIILARLLDKLDPSQQIEAVVNLLALIANFGPQHLADTKQSTEAWIVTDANRQSLYEQIDRLGNIPWQKIAAGMFRSRLDDGLLRQRMIDRYTQDPLNHEPLIGWLTIALDDRPELADLIIELITNPALDESVKVTVDARGRNATSVRAEILSHLSRVPENHRHRFKPLLDELAKSGKDGEVDAARSVQAKWRE